MAKYKRSIFIINPKFQYKLSFIICSFTLLATLIYPFIIVDLFDYIIELAPDKSAQYLESRNQLIGILGIIQLVFLGFLFVFSIFLSHKIAGPMYKLSKHLESIRNGGEARDLFFRNGDYFHDVAEDVNATVDYFVNQRQEDFAYLDEVSSYIANLALVVPEDKKPVLGEIQSNLAKIQSRNKED
ncbi:MAG: hypothetical protein KC478_03050 [Bacteriovoracaceae bacterium]|nr:hypothetical protein [Bacteriovoracaceae bacterium]